MQGDDDRVCMEQRRQQAGQLPVGGRLERDKDEVNRADFLRGAECRHGRKRAGTLAFDQPDTARPHRGEVAAHQETDAAARQREARTVEGADRAGADDGDRFEFNHEEHEVHEVPA